MNPILLTARYLLIIVPAISSMYLETYASYGIFTLYTLLLLWIAGLRRKREQRFEAYSMLLLTAEIGLGAWMTFQYDGLMFMTSCSTLLSYLHLQESRFRFFLLTLQFVLLQAAMRGQDASHYVIADLIFVAIALLLLHLHYTEHNKEEVEQLYDSLRRKHYELDEAKEQLADYARKVENIAQMEERTRISRDIHDDLGHKLIRLKMMMEAAIQILPLRQQQGMEMMTSVRDQLTESMELLRSTVRRLQPDRNTAHTYSLSKLIEDLSAESGIRVSYDIDGMPYSLYPSLEFILYRNAQEAVTNAIRHGAATQVWIRLSYDLKQIRMSVSNDGATPSQPVIKGIGFSGMEERVKLIGGELQVSSEAPFTVTTLLPSYRN